MQGEGMTHIGHFDNNARGKQNATDPLWQEADLRLDTNSIISVLFMCIMCIIAYKRTVSLWNY